MREQTRSARLAMAIGVLILVLFQLGALANPQNASASPTRDATSAAILAAHLPEPLVAITPTTSGENRALQLALTAYGQRVAPEDVSGLTAFLSLFPNSGWAPSVATNIGLLDLHYGYLSRAVEAFQNAWTKGRGATDPRAKALVDRAVGELARLYASLGQNDKLAQLFDEIGARPITGSATEGVQAAREELSLSAKDPRHLFICGPLALQALMLAQGAKQDEVNFLQWSRASPNGTNLAEVSELADKAKFSHRLIFRKPGQAVPAQAVMHWKTGHFAAIVGQANGRFHIVDSALANHDLWVTQAALDAEASGYFLLAANAQKDAEWRLVDKVEAGTVWGKGPTDGVQPGDAGDPPANPPCPNSGMCAYNIAESAVSLTLSDSPVGYTPPLGPSAKVKITYNQREDSQPATFDFFNVSQKWTLNWLSYVTDDPTNAGANVTRYLPGGGAYYYAGYQSGRGLFAAQYDDGSILVLASQSPVIYRRQLHDGGVEIYAQSNGATSYPRNVFLSQVIDPQGNALTLNYDTDQRLVSLTDAVGRQTTFTYGLFSQPLLITRITDPFGRSAALSYDTSGRLSSITDVLGLTSSFSYDANALVNSLTTPYGVTNFAYTAPGASGPPRFVQVTDPLGYNEREEWLEPAPISDSDPTSTVPVGMPVTPVNEYLSYRDSFHWDKNAYIVAGCTPTGGCDYTKARDTHFHHVPPNTSLKATSVESIKYALENRIWYTDPGQSDATGSQFGGTYNQPIAIGRVLDDGTTQLRQYSYDTTGYYNLTQAVDPLGRTTSYAYANHVDLSAISQTTAFGVQQTIAQFIYNTSHRPIFYTDAAGQTSNYTYNAAGQVTAITNALGQQTSYQYNTSGDLTTIINANSATAATFTYDAFDRIQTYTDSEGWTATYAYDAADRLTKITYPDGTADLYTYDKLDLASLQDRLGRTWTYTHDADRRLTKIVDPQSNQTVLGYNGIDELTSLTDANGNVTSWAYDAEGRLTQKTYADSSTITYTYETTTSLLRSILDPLGQTKQYSYAKDDLLTGIAYLGAVYSTPDVDFSYDPYFPRLTSMTDGNGTTQYTYVPIGSLGALQLQQEQSPLASSAITYAYDVLGRLSSRTVAGSGAETLGYDALGRLTAHTNDLGAFALTYLGQTNQVTTRQLASSTLSTAWTYLPNSGDRRLAGISNVGLSSGQYSTYQYTTVPGPFFNGVSETSDSAAVYPTTGTQTGTYNNLNQLTNLSGQALSFDVDGHLLSDGTRDYAWDAESRLVGITYPGQPGKSTAFAYDGLSRRTAISSTPTGGGTTTTSYMWCGARICQARNASDVPTRGYYAEGEFVPGSPGEPLYYGPDQIGSVRRVFVTTSNAPAYGYDPYGNALQTTALLTDFGFAGMFANNDSGLYLTQFRAYDPVSGRWLSRDPIGIEGGINLYAYVEQLPTGWTDRNGLADSEPGDPPGQPPGPIDPTHPSRHQPSHGGVSTSTGVPPPISLPMPAPLAACPGDLVAPGGQPIGTKNPGSSNPNIRNLPGGDQAAQNLFNDLAQFGTGESNPNLPWPNYFLPDGGFVGYRNAGNTSSNAPSVDVNIPNVFVGKFHFP